MTDTDEKEFRGICKASNPGIAPEEGKFFIHP
jgi:hypothetical protein